MDTNEIILEELRALRTDYNDNARETGERLATLESQVKSIVGNGRPGRLDNIESSVDSLSAWRWRIIGICSGVSGVVSVLGYLAFRH